MRHPLGHVEALVRYPVKSMAGEPLDEARLGLHGLEGDRRLAFRRRADRGGFPWLTAGRVPELLLYRPIASADGGIPTRVQTPDGRELDLGGDELRAELADRHGGDVELMRIDSGVFDEGSVSLITVDTIAAIERAVARPVDSRRFRPNVLVRGVDATAFGDNEWVGKTIAFGDGDDAPLVAVTLRDKRCAMINIDPDTGEIDAGVMKSVVRLNDCDAGVYATVLRAGTIRVGAPVIAHAW